MRILFLCHRIPYPLDKGEKIRAFYQLRAIAERHEVDLFTLVDNPKDLIYRDELAKYCHRLTLSRVFPRAARFRSLPYLLTKTPLTLPYFYSRQLATEVRRALVERSYDRIFVYCSAMAQYVPDATSIPIIMDLVDVDSDKWRQYASKSMFPFSTVYRHEADCLREYERQICKNAESVLVTTELEAQLVRRLSGEIRVHVVSMGIDIDRLTPPPSQPERNAPTVLFIGAMNYFPNQEAVCFFARQVFPLIRQSVPNVRFLIVGRSPGRRVRELEKLPGVEVTGYVPDVGDVLTQAHVSVAPFSITAGIQSKILEALAFGLPVVATQRAVQALATDVAEIIETGETADELASKVVYFLSNPSIARSRGLEGRRRVTAAYSWRRSLEQLLHLVEEPGCERVATPSLSTEKGEASQ